MCPLPEGLSFQSHGTVTLTVYLTRSFSALKEGVAWKTHTHSHSPTQ